MVVCLERGADCLHIVRPMSLPSQNLIISYLIKSQKGFTFWYWLTKVVLEKMPLNGCLFVSDYI